MSITVPLARGSKTCDDCEWIEGWPHCTMNCSDAIMTLHIPNDPGYVQPQCKGFFRDAVNANVCTLVLDRPLTDDELRALHDHVRKFHYRQPWRNTDD